MTETRLCGLADGSVVLQALVDGVWVIVDSVTATVAELPEGAHFIGEQSATVDDAWLGRNAAALQPRRGRKPKSAA